MYKEVLRSIDGVSVYPIISLLIFFTFFVGVAIWYFRADKRLNQAAHLPLEPAAPAQEANA